MLDVTTTELADELVGGVLSAGPDRLEAAGALGIPQVVSLGALDMVNFGPFETRAGAASGTGCSTSTTPRSPSCARRRRSARSSAGRSPAKLNAARGPLTLFVPLRGVSLIATEGQPFHDPDADEALVRRAARAPRPRASTCASSTWTSTTRTSRRRWPTGSHELYRAWARDREEVRA